MNAADDYPDLARLARLAQIDPHAHAGMRQATEALAELERLRATVNPAQDDYPLLDWQGQSKSPDEQGLSEEIVAALAELDRLREENTRLRAAATDEQLTWLSTNTRSGWWNDEGSVMVIFRPGECEISWYAECGIEAVAGETYASAVEEAMRSVQADLDEAAAGRSTGNPTPPEGSEHEFKRCQQNLAIRARFPDLLCECGHTFKRHDPEDGKCDSHAMFGVGVCWCGRSAGGSTQPEGTQP